jgi:hypothetical protein
MLTQEDQIDILNRQLIAVCDRFLDTVPDRAIALKVMTVSLTQGLAAAIAANAGFDPKLADQFVMVCEQNLAKMVERCCEARS